ncbi:SPOR domain-containing protein [Ectothiorhodospira mobilis]|uniref:SPOR domain-containing protein n=1 Tax=Ectothiorhodospira mobilis TaxID=195064 RepID=UPI001EE90A3F|nr:SPOR domain-containing protein [Ectothiorhodospira mobilis]MCG5534825.1 SPOR domain-containing protein [Ectothiorhodospira mobilis]
MAAKRAQQASRKTPPPEEKPPLPGWVWGAAGLAIGLFTALLVYLDANRPAPEAAREGVVQEAPRNGAGEGGQPRFDFYTLLPELEVAVPEQAPAPPAPQPPSRNESLGEPATPAPRAEPPAAEGARYVIQAGAFQKAEQADRMRASLAMLGIEAHIQKVRVNHDTWHRVRIGPFDDRKNLERMRRRLAEHRIQTVTVTLPDSG